MQYFSTNRTSPHAGFREATRRGQPDDKGLYFPERIPLLSDDFLRTFGSKSKAEIAFEVIAPYVGGEIPDDELLRICDETVNFDFPLVSLTPEIAALELFHGPTLAFKDVGARFMSRCLRYFSKTADEKTVVIVATSGDTGGAVANGFYDVDGVEVVILYPKGKVSRVQELQLTTLGKNISALEVEGTFDDCQALAKTALADDAIKSKVFLTSANSINVARWLPQQFYYFYALQQWQGTDAPVVCVPSGNFGNICAGILAHISGLPVAKFIAATNANDVIPKYFETGEMSTQKSVATLSNAMDVAAPSNFVRVLEIFGRDFINLKEKVVAVSVSDETTVSTMREVFETTEYVLDPHGAVGFRALDDYLTANPGASGLFLETAHPVKFDSVEKILGTSGEIPASVAELENRAIVKTTMPAEYAVLSEILLAKV